MRPRSDSVKAVATQKPAVPIHSPLRPRDKARHCCDLTGNRIRARHRSSLSCSSPSLTLSALTLSAAQSTSHKSTCIAQCFSCYSKGIDIYIQSSRPQRPYGSASRSVGLVNLSQDQSLTRRRACCDT